MSQSMREWVSSPEYQLRKFQNPELEPMENTLQDFIFFLEHDSEQETSPKELKKIKSLVKEFLGYDMKIVQQAEQERLQAWKLAVQGE